MVVIPSGTSLGKRKLRQAADSTRAALALRTQLVSQMLSRGEVRAACGLVQRWQLTHVFEPTQLLQRMLQQKEYTAVFRFAREFGLTEQYPARALLQRMLEERRCGANSSPDSGSDPDPNSNPNPDPNPNPSSSPSPKPQAPSPKPHPEPGQVRGRAQVRAARLHQRRRPALADRRAGDARRQWAHGRRAQVRAQVRRDGAPRMGKPEPWPKPQPWPKPKAWPSPSPSP